MPLVVQKYGGSSLATSKHIQRAARRIKSVKESGKDIVVVVSAMGRTTDHLLRLARKTVRQPPAREVDMLLTAGERVSMSLLAMCLSELGIPAISFTGSQSGIVTSSEHTHAKIKEVRAHRIREELEKGKVVIIAGFQGVSAEKEITTLGRGGSDTTAVALAAVLKAEVCEILTDVDGLFSADPRLVPRARLLSSCTYDEALELASLGAKMQSRSIELAKRFEVNVRIASSFHEQSAGTLLGKRSLGHLPGRSQGEIMEETIIRGVTTRDGYTCFRAQHPLKVLLPVLEKHRVPLRFFQSTSESSSFLCEEEKAPILSSAFSADGISFSEESKVAVVSVVGEGLSSSAEVLPEFLRALEAANAECLVVVSNSLSISAAVSSAAKAEVARKLHAKFLEI